MKNKSPDPEVNIFRKKGFFIALYSCLGAVAILALVITLANFGQPGYQAEDYQEDAAYVGADQVAPYLAQVDDEAWFRPRETPEPEPTPQAPEPTPTPRPIPVHPTPLPVEEQDLQTPAPEQAYDEALDEAYDPTYVYPSDGVSASYMRTAFTPFRAGDELLWPVNGDIAMRFSTDALIYDPTLAQFRTNDNLRIYAEEGDYVQAGAAGRVMAIGRNVIRGNYVKIDHGNGWIATYGQLADNKLVAEGDTVMAGQRLGTVGEPSIFGSMHGHHVHLHLTRDGEPVDPYAFLASR